MDNILQKITLDIDTRDFLDDKVKLILDNNIRVDDLYSYIIYANYKSDQLIGWTIECLYSQTMEFNTITKDELIDGILVCIKEHVNNKNKYNVIGYKQPPLELLIQIFDPLIKKLSEQQMRHWTDLEFEDLCQICRTVICILHDKGYYIHKRLIQKGFTNAVLKHIRKDKYKPTMVSLDQMVMSSENENGIALYDTILDDDAEIEMHAFEEEMEKTDILLQKRALIMEFVGERQYDQLVREYGHKMTTPWSRNLVMKLKGKLKELGINWKSFY